ncbi:MAG: hypothetical protein O7G30_16900 [Proteobacteria bacterium]|nr:hypothetical protein [Pseudomonadota bacterium]
MKKYRVVQWATGVVGSAALRGILRHPKLELVGVKVYSEAKEGLDAGDIIGTDRTRVRATRDVDAIMALNAVPLVCDAENPGLKTFLDLPMITGCMGSHTTAR